MKREIKFRAFWKDTGKIILDFNEEYIIDACNDNVFIVEQFTGLKDKNGVDIYEGDILKHVRKYNSGHISECQVVFRKGGFSLDYGNLIYESIDIIYRTDYQFEVIGNIHETPELLKH